MVESQQCQLISSFAITAEKPAHKVGDFKRNSERKYEMENAEKFKNEREKKWCSYHQTNGHSDK